MSTPSIPYLDFLYVVFASCGELSDKVHGKANEVTEHHLYITRSAIMPKWGSKIPKFIGEFSDLTS